LLGSAQALAAREFKINIEQLDNEWPQLTIMLEAGHWTCAVFRKLAKA